MPVIKSNTNLFKSVINNAALDPIQGFDADVWVLDQGTGSFNLVGRFTSIQVTVRNATEPYIEYNQRIPRQLDGEIQIGWVMERGQLDGRVLEQTFGIPVMSRELRLNRMPRFQITFAVSSSELDEGAVVSNDAPAATENKFAQRVATTELILTFCKVDTFTMGSNSGRSVVANRWEGLAEGIEVVARKSSVDPGAIFEGTLAEDAIIQGQESAAAVNPYPWDETLRNNLVNNRDIFA